MANDLVCFHLDRDELCDILAITIENTLLTIETAHLLPDSCDLIWIEKCRVYFSEFTECLIEDDFEGIVWGAA